MARDQCLARRWQNYEGRSTTQSYSTLPLIGVSQGGYKNTLWWFSRGHGNHQGAYN
ncbi:hypothetical protein SCLCIDRAFT_1216113 [Scleroderma citrinum Foug A]|uniref:Uncharacterized protein n=1 Tax=Scleroderma citrinum Foug A TaxID=1036808 RepID=A0A0C3DYC9_9AGAM|nr:hypothetical protein SCLCIDRAFT_1216113 [Scleroderma citrinum Foug A]